jgi:cytochrome c553
MRLPCSLALAAILTFCALPTLAAEKPARLGLCASCHGEDGHALAPATPNLAGQNLDYLRSAVRQYQSGARDVPAMRAALGMLGAADLERVLMWYAQTPVVSATP